MWVWCGVVWGLEAKREGVSTQHNTTTQHITQYNTTQHNTRQTPHTTYHIVLAVFGLFGGGSNAGHIRAGVRLRDGQTHVLFAHHNLTAHGLHFVGAGIEDGRQRHAIDGL
jgi:hypothetical protein